MYRINRINREEIMFLFGAAFLLVILWLTIAYFGVGGAIVYCLVFTFVLTSFSRLLYAWGGRSLTLEEAWLPPLISLAASSFVSLGIYYLVQFSQTGILNGMVFYPWLAIALGGPALYFLPPRVKRYLQLRDQARNCVASDLRVEHDVNMPICVDKLIFNEGTKDRELEIYVSAYRDDSNRDEDKKYSSLSQRINNASRVIYYDQAFIPSGADKFYLSWYSVLEDKYYQGEFPFSFDGFEMHISKFDDAERLWDHLHRQSAGAVSISIHPNGSVYVSQNSHIVICYANINNQNISDKQRENLLQHFRPYGQFSTSIVSELMAAEQEQDLTVTRLSQLGINRKQVFNWCMRFENLNENNKLDIDDAARFSYRGKLEEFSILDIKPLPEKIEVMYRGPSGLLPWLFIYVEVESLHRSVQLLTGGNKNVPVEFVVTVEDSHNNTIQFIINSNGQSVAFNAWETAVNEEHKRKSRQLVKSTQERKMQYQLLDSAWSDVKNRDYQAAEEKCVKLLSQIPVFKQVYFLQARLIFYKGGVAEYLSKIDDLVAKAGDDKFTLSRLYNATGCVFDEEKRYAEALVYFEKASSIETEDGMYLANIAEIHYKMGNAKEAIKFAHQAKEKKFESDMMSEILMNSGVMSQDAGIA